jgi:CubicO group peptidase (beta-lactamase class C family)
LDRDVPALLEKTREPGIAVAFIDGCKSSIRTYGLAKKEPATPVRADTVFNLGSISKTVTAWAVMTLVEAGRVKLDDPADTYLKRWRLPESTFDRRAVTVRRLLNHTAGISISSVSAVDRGAPIPSLIDDLNGVGPAKTAVQIIKMPGEAFQYSGGGYAVLQLLVEDVTGQAFAEYAKKMIFVPLGMTSTSFGWTPETVQHAATPYLNDGIAYRLREFPASGAAGLVSTAQDMSTFLLEHCPGAKTHSEHAVLKPQTLERMRTDTVLAAAIGRGARYGLGYNVRSVLPYLELVARRLFSGPMPQYDIAGHSGSNTGWKAELWMMPPQGLGIVILTNTAEGKVRRDVMEMFRAESRSRIKR